MNAVPVSDYPLSLAAYGVLLLATFTGAAIDVRHGRIPNLLTAGLAVVGIAYHATQGIGPAVVAIATAVTVFLVGALAFSAGWFGGGDVKLIAASCTVASFPGSVPLLFEIFLAGAFLSVVYAALQGRLATLMRSTVALASFGVAAEKAGTVPYGVAVAAGALTYTLSAFIPALRLPL